MDGADPSPAPAPAPKRAGAPTERVALVILAAGYGTRLARDVAECAAFRHLTGVPKPLLPVGGRVILSHWVDAMRGLPNLVDIVIVTNDAHLPQYQAWAARSSPSARVLSDGSTSNANRLGAVAAMALGARALGDAVDVALFVAGDTILPGFDAGAHLARFLASGRAVGLAAYELSDPLDCAQRGMLAPDATGATALRLVEKPATPAEAPSNLACAPVYALRAAALPSFGAFLAAHADAPLAARDAPGFWAAWALARVPAALLRVRARLDIGGLAHYRAALAAAGAAGAARDAREPAVARACARAGLLGNPSDGYAGKTLALALRSEGFAEVVATPAAAFSVARNPAHELPAAFASPHELAAAVAKRGVHYGARALVVAAAAAFAQFLPGAPAAAAGAPANGNTAPPQPPNCMLSYATSIPARLGLSGSSALILATFRALARFHGTSLRALDPDIASWPPRLRAVERELLGIECGLMDRVAQVYLGCVFMDFSRGDGAAEVERVDEARVPELWIAYCAGDGVGEHSGKVHSDLGERFRRGDPDVIDRMRLLGDIAEQGRVALRKGGDVNVLPKLMRENFRLRLELVGAEAVGERNLALVRTAEGAGFAAKMSGSGGAVICLPDPVRELSAEEVGAAREKFKEAGMVLRKVEVMPRCDWAVDGK